jgi:hypothetical protein
MNDHEFLWVRNRLDVLEAKLDRLLAVVTAGASFLPGSPGPDDADALDLLGDDTHGSICLDDERRAIDRSPPRGPRPAA